METNHRVRKIKWLCRRGMKELDIMLERFVDEVGRDGFARDLTTSSTVLSAWLCEACGGAPAAGVAEGARREACVRHGAVRDGSRREAPPSSPLAAARGSTTCSPAIRDQA